MVVGYQHVVFCNIGAKQLPAPPSVGMDFVSDLFLELANLRDVAVLPLRSHEWFRSR